MFFIIFFCLVFAMHLNASVYMYFLFIVIPILGVCI